MRPMEILYYTQRCFYSVDGIHFGITWHQTIEKHTQSCFPLPRSALSVKIELNFMITGNYKTEENITAILSQKTAVHLMLRMTAARQWISIPLSFVSCNLLPHFEKNWSGSASNGPPFCPLSPTNSTQECNPIPGIQSNDEWINPTSSITYYNTKPEQFGRQSLSRSNQRWAGTIIWNICGNVATMNHINPVFSLLTSVGFFICLHTSVSKL